MKVLNRISILSFLICTIEIGLLGASFNLPDETPGLQADVQGNHGNRKHIIVPGTHCHLYFPIDGYQPNTQDAGVWSGARYVNQNNDNAVTEWWVRVFGGNRAIQLLYGNYVVPDEDNLLPMGYDNMGAPYHIMEVVGTVDFERQFWQTFRTIAANSVGRVLLYRLLIEIRRTHNNNGCCEDGIVTIQRRNNLRSIKILYTNVGLSFSPINCCINFNTLNTQSLTLHIDPITGNITIQDINKPNDVALFHEMLHWFHCLRDIQRVVNNRALKAGKFKYVMRCYYGDQSELCIWDATPCNAEDMAVILGTPNYNNTEHLAYIPQNAFFSLINRPIEFIPIIDNLIQGYVESYIPFTDRFLNGEDLSENAYRCSQGLPMRWGHSVTPFYLVDYHNIPLRYRLAHKVAVDCYTEITGHPPVYWQLQPGEAINN